MAYTTLLPIDEVCQRTALSRPMIYRLLKEEPTFPKPVLKTRNGTGTAWKDNEIEDWIQSLPRSKDDQEEAAVSV